VAREIHAHSERDTHTERETHRHTDREPGTEDYFKLIDAILNHLLAAINE